MKARKLSATGLLSIGFITGILWVVSCGGSSVTSALASAASEITYSNTTSGLTATTVQAAIDEVISEDAANARAAVASQDLTLGAITGDSFTLGAAKTGYITVVGGAFIPDTGDADSGTSNYSTSNSKRRGKASSTTTFHAPVFLPNGATITSLTTYIDNNDGGGGTAAIALNRLDISLDDNADEVEEIASTTTANSGFEEVDNSPSNATVDNSTYAYFLTLSITEASGSAANIEAHGAKITYTYSTF